MEWVEVFGDDVILPTDEITACMDRDEGWVKAEVLTRGVWVGKQAKTLPDYLRVRRRFGKPEPLRWVENCKPDKPGIWARIDNRAISFACVNHEDIDTITWDSATRCYLGPIPEILPPKRKVVQRLWLEQLSTSTADGMTKTTYQEVWLNDDCEIDNPCRMLRTDRTREVEQ